MPGIAANGFPLEQPPNPKTTQAAKSRPIPVFMSPLVTGYPGCLGAHLLLKIARRVAHAAGALPSNRLDFANDQGPRVRSNSQRRRQSAVVEFPGGYIAEIHVVNSM